jgi:hypothetical protein
VDQHSNAVDHARTMVHSNAPFPSLKIRFDAYFTAISTHVISTSFGVTASIKL